MTGIALKLQRTAFRFFWRRKSLRPLLRHHVPIMQSEIAGHVFHLNLVDNLSERRMWLTGKWPEPVSIARMTVLAAGKKALILDIGANCGAYTLPLAASGAEGSKVVAFEPNPKLANRLRKNIQLNGMERQVDVHEVAIGSEAYQGVLNLDEYSLGRSSLRSARSRTSLSVPVRPLSDFIPESLEKFDTFLIKIDVEGCEDDALVPFLSQAPRQMLPDAVMLEVIHRNQWRVDLFRHLSDLGYSAHFAGEEGNALFLAP